MLTRPGTAVLDLLTNTAGQPHRTGDLVAEGLFLGLLLLAHLLVVWGAFRWSQRRWDALLR